MNVQPVCGHVHEGAQDSTAPTSHPIQQLVLQPHSTGSNWNTVCCTRHNPESVHGRGWPRLAIYTPSAVACCLEVRCCGQFLETRQQWLQKCHGCVYRRPHVRLERREPGMRFLSIKGKSKTTRRQGALQDKGLEELTCDAQVDECGSSHD